MARADLIINLAKAGATGDRTLFKRTLQAMIAEERRKQHTVVAERLETYLGNGSTNLLANHNGIQDERVASLLTEVSPRMRFEDLILPDPVRRSLNEVVDENRRRQLLQSYNLEPRNRVLLVGPPGNGKTSVAHALADALALPLLVVRYEGAIGSYLGETAARIGRLFSFVRTRCCVLFFDEFETLGKERGDVHDTGEIKRVVSSLLLQIDDLPSHVLVVAATNHQELLDRAVWRRFQVRLTLPSPTRAQREAWATRFIGSFEERVGLASRTLANKLQGLSYSDMDELAGDVRRRRVLALPDADLPRILRESLDELKFRARVSDHAEGA